MRALFLIFILACNSSDELSSTLPKVSDFNENEIGMPVITITRDGVALVRASSNTLVKNHNSNAILRGDVKADFYDEKGLLISKLKSDSAYIDQNTNNLLAYGDVIVASNDSVKLFSNSILWDNHYELITSRDSVTFTTSSGDTMHGIGFESDMDLTKWKIKKPRGIRNN